MSNVTPAVAVRLTLPDWSLEDVIADPLLPVSRDASYQFAIVDNCDGSHGVADCPAACVMFIETEGADSLATTIDPVLSVDVLLLIVNVNDPFPVPLDVLIVIQSLFNVFADHPQLLSATVTVTVSVPPELVKLDPEDVAVKVSQTIDGVVGVWLILKDPITFALGDSLK